MSNAYEYRKIIKDTLMTKLFNKQLLFWNNKLHDISYDNAKSFGRLVSSNIENENWWEYLIFYRNRKWHPVYLDTMNDPETAQCLPLNEDQPNFTKRMNRIADELTELREEIYEAERFLSGLVLFNAPPNIFKKIMGDTLFGAIKKELDESTYTVTYTHPDSIPAVMDAEFSLQVYADTNVRIIQAMNERIVLNLLTI